MAEKLIDMHMHTNYSDGELNPDELIEKAISNNVKIMSITDHDTIEGLKNINKDYSDRVEIVNGIELSAKASKGRMHILGYDFDINNQKLNDKLYELKNNSLQRILSLIEQLKKDYNIFFTYDEIKALINSNHNLGRPDLAKLLIKHNLAETVDEAFRKYLVDANKKIKGINNETSYEECFNLIINSGGIPVLAHPKSLELEQDELNSLIKKMKEAGLQGIEVYHSSHTKEEIKYYLFLAKKYNLLVSGGSDYHGSIVKPNIEIATGDNNNLKIRKLSLVDRIKSRH